jgi:hypothetical protein
MVLSCALLLIHLVHYGCSCKYQNMCRMLCRMLLSWAAVNAEGRSSKSSTHRYPAATSARCPTLMLCQQGLVLLSEVLPTG